MALRKPHGSARGAGSPRVEVLPPDELPSVAPAIAVRSDRGANGQFTAGNTASRSRRATPGKLGGVDTSSPEFRPFKHWARRYAGHRRDELAKVHGGDLSAGVGAIIESASLALASSRYCQAKGAETNDVDLLKRAADLSALARQHELAAWELAAREAAARPKKKGATPW